MPEKSEGESKIEALTESLGVRTPEQQREDLAQKIVAELDELKWIHTWEDQEVVKYIAYSADKFDEDFVRRIFDSCGLAQHAGSNALEVLRHNTDWIVSEDFAPDLRFMPRPKKEEYAERLRNERGEELEPEKVEVSQTLHDLAQKITDPNERMFYEETRLCLEAKAYRAAIVMGWNLAYGHLTRWVLADANRLKAFNDDLTSKWVNRRRNTRYEEIVDKEDFGNVKESIAIEVCWKAKLVSKEDYDILDSGLRKRNKFAHPNSTATANGPIASGHVAELVEFMLTLK